MSEVQSLIIRAQEFQSSFDFWNKAYVRSVGFAVFVAAIVFFAQFMVIRRGKQLSIAQAELLEAKDKQLVADLRDKDFKLAELGKETAVAKLETEKIKKSVAWRTISAKEAAELVKILSSTPGSVNLRYMDGDPEALFLAIQLSQVLDKAKWKIASGATKPSNSILFGLSLPDNDSVDAKSLRSAFSSAKIPFSSEALPPVGGVSFSVSTFKGAPTLMVGSKKPVLPWSNP